MSENINPFPVKGYTPQPQYKIDTVNKAKELEERVLRYLDQLRTMPDVDQRCISVAYTNIQDAFMWANRAVFAPKRIQLPEDEVKNDPSTVIFTDATLPG